MLALLTTVLHSSLLLSLNGLAIPPLSAALQKSSSNGRNQQSVQNKLTLSKSGESKFKRCCSSSISVPSIDAIVAINSAISEDGKTTPKSKALLWRIGDTLDKRILVLALPAILNMAIIPLVGAADTFWVGRMKNALSLAGQGAANQVARQ